MKSYLSKLVNPFLTFTLTEWSQWSENTKYPTIKDKISQRLKLGLVNFAFDKNGAKQNAERRSRSVAHIHTHTRNTTIGTIASNSFSAILSSSSTIVLKYIFKFSSHHVIFTPNFTKCQSCSGKL
jgi:Fe2+ or Zn2+ uptake regulation protein